MHFVDNQDLRAWLTTSDDVTTLNKSIGVKQVGADYLEDVVGLPLHIRFVTSKMEQEEEEGIAPDALASIPFYSLCKGLLLPLSGLSPDRVASMFSLEVPAPPMYAEREELVRGFLANDALGLSLTQRLAAVLGDAFEGERSTFRRDSLIRLIAGMDMVSRRDVLDRLRVVGDIAIVFAERRPRLKETPALTAAEVLATLRFLPPEPRTFKLDVLRDLLARMGKLEAYFLAKLLLRRAGFGFDYQGPLLARALADAHGADVDQVTHAMALTDPFYVGRVLATEGVEGLRYLQLQPLTPVRPALATVGDIEAAGKWPQWVERKYDGIRLMLHKTTDATGAMLCGAYTRRKGDWLELIPGLDMAIKMLPARTVILDGELYGSLGEIDRVRPATVYEVYSTLQGEGRRANLRYAAFDLLYVDGVDLTDLPLRQRRQRLQALLAPLVAMPLPVPFTLAEGQLANSPPDVNRLYQHFRSQGYEGIIAKDLDAPYVLASRDKTWIKKKPALTLDLVLLGAVFAVTEKENAGMFGSYIIGARTADGTFEDVGDVAGIDRARDMDIQAEIMREGLLTGRRIERTGVSGTRAGVELSPHIVVTVKLEGILKDNTTGKFHLRAAKLAHIRSDKGPHDCDKLGALEELYLKQRVG